MTLLRSLESQMKFQRETPKWTSSLQNWQYTCIRNIYYFYCIYFYIQAPLGPIGGLSLKPALPPLKKLSPLAEKVPLGGLKPLQKPKLGTIEKPAVKKNTFSPTKSANLASGVSKTVGKRQISSQRSVDQTPNRLVNRRQERSGDTSRSSDVTSRSEEGSREDRLAGMAREGRRQGL